MIEFEAPDTWEEPESDPVTKEYVDQQYRKPPIGLLPQKLADERTRAARRDDIRAAITRYLNANWTVPAEWLWEWNDLIEKDWHD